jgi:hypothetical protein
MAEWAASSCKSHKLEGKLILICVSVLTMNSIVTASPHNGPLILRHELGHTIIDVGEEYDGGFNYSGVNTATDLSVPWTQWQTDPSLTEVKI